MLAAITSAVTQLISWVGQVISAIVGENGAMGDLLPIFAIGIAVSVVLVALKIIRKVCWSA